MNKNVKLNGNLSELSPGPIYVTPGGLQAVILAKGKLDIQVSGL
jgi:hypothetical protein